MLTNAYVTIFGESEDGEGYIKRFGGIASFHGSVKIAPSDKGFIYGSGYTVRVPSDADLGFKVGDFICVGEFEDIPDRDKRLKVIGVTDNRRGNLRHWRLDCV